MKIFLIASAFRPYSNSGADVAVENTVDGLLNLNHEVVVLTAGFWQGITSLWPRAEVLPTKKGKLVVYRYFPLNLFSFLTINSRPWWLRLPWHGFDMLNLHAYLVTWWCLKKEKPELALTHNLKGVGYFCIRAVERYARRYHSKHIHTIHDVQLSVPSGRIITGEEDSWQSSGFLTRWYQALNRWIFSSPAIVVSASDFLLNFYVTRGFFSQSHRVVLLNPLQPVAPAAYISHQGSLHFLYLGQIESHKGVTFLVETFKKFLQHYPNQAKLTVVGGGALLAVVKKIASDCKAITISGPVPHHDLPKIFSQVDATIFPSLCYENSPTIIGESLSFGVPVIAAQIGGVQLVQPGVNGYTFRAGDTDDLFRVLEHSVTNRQELVNFRSKARASVEGLDIDSYLNKLLNLN